MGNAFLTGLLVSLAAGVVGQDIQIEPVTKLKLYNVKAEAVTYKGRKAVRIDDAATTDLREGARYALVTGTDFHDGVIEVDLTGDTLPGTNPTFRGFTGVGFRWQAMARVTSVSFCGPRTDARMTNCNAITRRSTSPYRSFPGRS